MKLEYRRMGHNLSIHEGIDRPKKFFYQVLIFLQENQNIKFKLEVVSLRDSKTAEPIFVEINISKLPS